MELKFLYILSPLAQTAVDFGIDVLSRLRDHPSFDSYTQNMRQLREYYARVMRDEMKTIIHYINCHVTIMAGGKTR